MTRAPNVRVEYISRLSSSCSTCVLQARRFVESAVKELQSEGRTDLAYPYTVDDRATVALDSEHGVVGVVVWSVDSDRRAFVTTTYVHKNWRRCGIYRTMWNSLLVTAAAVGATSVSGLISADNEAMRAAARAVGRTEVAILSRTYL